MLYYSYKNWPVLEARESCLHNGIEGFYVCACMCVVPKFK